jgi:hypothetical protein
MGTTMTEDEVSSLEDSEEEDVVLEVSTQEDKKKGDVALEVSTQENKKEEDYSIKIQSSTANPATIYIVALLLFIKNLKYDTVGNISHSVFVIPFLVLQLLFAIVIWLFCLLVWPGEFHIIQHTNILNNFHDIK